MMTDMKYKLFEFASELSCTKIASRRRFVMSLIGTRSEYFSIHIVLLMLAPSSLPQGILKEGPSPQAGLIK